VRSLPSFDTTGLAASLLIFPVGLACYGSSSEQVGEKEKSLPTCGILFVLTISKSAPPSAVGKTERGCVVCRPVFFLKKNIVQKNKQTLWHVVTHGGQPQMLPKVGNIPGQFLGF